MMPQAEAFVADQTLLLQQAWTTAVQEILGPESDLPPSPNPARPWENLLPALCSRYGEAAGLGLGLRVGRAFARQMLPHIAEQQAFQRAEFRFLPWPRKMKAGIHHLAALASEWFGLVVNVETGPKESLLWLPQRCPFTAPNAAPCRCTPWEGFLQEVLYWLSGGRLFALHAAEDHPTALYIPRHPLH